MKRSLLACFVGLLTWIVIVSLFDRGLRLALPDYTTAERALQFTLSMKLARLLMSIVTSIAAGAVTRWVAPLSRWAPWAVGGVVFAMFVPLHIAIWSRLPTWYNLTFLLTIVPSVLVGAAIPRRRHIAAEITGVLTARD